MLEVTMTMKGERPLVVKSDRSVNPLDPLTRELAKLSGKRKKTEEDHAMMSRIEFELGIYWEQELGPYIPTGNVHKALVQGARQSKLGRQVEQGCIPLEVRTPILYQGPRGIDDLFDKPDHVYKVSVGVGQKRVMRTRARFPNWALQVPFVLDPEKLDLDTFEKIAEVTGRYIGIGERRPMFGAFTAHIETKKETLNGNRSAVSAG
jgi:hypothetical protein